MQSTQRRRLWFRARAHSWGWNPVTWEGWMALGAYFAAVLGWMGYVALTRDLGVAFHLDPLPAVPPVILTALLLMLCWLKSERRR